MDYFRYKDGQLYCEEVNVNELAKKVETPFYLYSQRTIQNHYSGLSEAFSKLNPLICYSIKNCSNLHVLKLLADMGAGMDVVSKGELFRAIQVGVNPSKIVFAGVGKSSDEIRTAIERGIGWINIESEEELLNINRIASELKKSINVAIRINPNVYDPRTHQKTATGIQDSKFGIDMLQAKRLYIDFLNNEYVKLTGLHIHIGSPIYSGDPYQKAITKVFDFIDELRSEGVAINMIDIGGGFLAKYHGNESVDSWDEYSDQIVPLLQNFVNQGGQVVLEPGRSIAANAGILVTKVQYRKQGVHKKFIIVDTGMSHLIRPAFYDAYHFIWPVSTNSEYQLGQNRVVSPQLEETLDKYDVVGPICESSDFLAKDRALPAVEQGDLLAVFTAGSYAMSMASQYNSIPRPAEILVSDDTVRVIRRRETYADLVALEVESPEIL